MHVDVDAWLSSESCKLPTPHFCCRLSSDFFQSFKKMHTAKCYHLLVRAPDDLTNDFRFHVSLCSGVMSGRIGCPFIWIAIPSLNERKASINGIEL